MDSDLDINLKNFDMNMSVKVITIFETCKILELCNIETETKVIKMT